MFPLTLGIKAGDGHPARHAEFHLAPLRHSLDSLLLNPGYQVSTGRTSSPHGPPLARARALSDSACSACTRCVRNGRALRNDDRSQSILMRPAVRTHEDFLFLTIECEYISIPRDPISFPLSLSLFSPPHVTR